MLNEANKTTNMSVNRGQATQRNTNLELYRIVVMLLIIAHHYVVNSGLTNADGPIYADPLSWSSIFLLLFGAWGKIGINCFVLISGYFMCKSHITVKKFLKLLCEVMFYRLVINTILWVTGYAPFTLKEFLKLLLPITNIGTDFTSAYLLFFLCIPFLNILVDNINERQHIKLLLVCSFMYILLGTAHAVTMNYVSWFIVLYFIASYIRLYPKKLFTNKRFWGYASGIFLLLSAASVVACTWLGTKLGRNVPYAFVTDSNTVLAVLTGISTFMFMNNVEMKYSRWINTVAATTFGVFLIHTNNAAMRQWLWQDVLHNVEMYSSNWMPIHAIVSVLGVFAVCAVIDYLRIRCLEVPFFREWDKCWGKVSQLYQKYEERVCRKMDIS